MPQLLETPQGAWATKSREIPLADAPRWLTRYATSVFLMDGVMLCLAGLAALWSRFGLQPGVVQGINYVAVAAGLVALWWVVLGLSRCYESRFLGAGSEEFTRVFNGSLRLAALVAVTSYAFAFELARGFVAVALPLGIVLLLLGRYAARVTLHAYRKRGRFSHRVVVIGDRAQVVDLVRQLRQEPDAGFVVVGACLPGLGHTPLVFKESTSVPIVGSLLTLPQALADTGADTVAVAASPGINSQAIRQLSYELEGTGIDLVVAPTLVNVSGSRVTIRPVAGLPLLHLEEPELDGARRLIKATFDRTVASLGLLCLLPGLLLVAVLIASTSRGPVIFRQTRVGRRGETFTVWKFRSMERDAETRRDVLDSINEHDGVLFKVRQDPRITAVGRWLRRYSVDELPQLVNVVRGQMSLVGPRPPLLSEVQRYEGHAHRRLLVKPGMTGLWQVSGRSELTWDDTVRLDLRYVESWSLALDLAVLVKTVSAVIKGRGAY